MSVAELARLGPPSPRRPAARPAALRRVAEHVPDPLSSLLTSASCAAGRRGARRQADSPRLRQPSCSRRSAASRRGNGTWQRGSDVGAEWGRRGVDRRADQAAAAVAGRPTARLLPVFFDTEPRLGIGRGRKAASQTVQWLRAGHRAPRRSSPTAGSGGWSSPASTSTPGAEWDVDLWFEEGALVAAGRRRCARCCSPALWTPPTKDAHAAAAPGDSRQPQGTSRAVGRARRARARGGRAAGPGARRRARSSDCADVDPSDIYRAAVRIVMRMVVVLFAESRETAAARQRALPRRVRPRRACSRSWRRSPRGAAIAWRGRGTPGRACWRCSGSSSTARIIPTARAGVRRRAVRARRPDVERRARRARSPCSRPPASTTSCCSRPRRPSDARAADAHAVRIRQGRASTWVSAPVDFSDLSSEYIGILYEGLLDFELKTAPAGDPVVFLAVGNQPALPLSRLEAMDDKALASLLEKMKDTSSGGRRTRRRRRADDAGRSRRSTDDDVEESKTRKTSCGRRRRRGDEPTRRRATHHAHARRDVGAPRGRGRQAGDEAERAR